MRKWQYVVYGFIYDGALGLPEEGIPAGTRWEDIPADQVCPDYGVGRTDLEMIEIAWAKSTETAPGADNHRETEISEHTPPVVIGTGLAGYNLARKWRKLDGETPLLMITADGGRSYSKPMLPIGFSKNKDADGLAMAEPGAMAEQLSTHILTRTRVIDIDPGHQRIWIGEEEVRYRDLVLAWDAEPIRMSVEGDTQDALYLIDDLKDYARFRQAAVGKRRVLLLGAGLIGCEFVNDLSSGGYRLDMVTPCEQAVPGLLHPAVARAVQAGLKGLGVRFRLGPVLTSLKKVGEGLEAHLSDGEMIPCDLMVSAVGLRPRTELAFVAGLAVNRGIVVDHSLRTPYTNIYTLGDCTEVGGLNLLYVMPLITYAHVPAQTLAGNPSQVAYGPMPVAVKTPAHPLVVSPPPRGMDGQ